MDAPFPALILALAEQAQGTPLAYREDDEKIVIVFTDGRKLTFVKNLHYYTEEINNDLPPAERETVPDQVQGGQEPPQEIKKSKRKEKKANG